MPASTASGSSSHSRSSTTSCSTTGIPAARNRTFCTALSMPTAEASTPAPTYGTPATSRNPWIEPSSPYGPCITGNTTSMGVRDPSSATRVWDPGSWSKATSGPEASVTRGRWPGGPAARAAGPPGTSCHRPSLVTPMGMTSYRPGSRASITERAETTETSCSADRPPNRMAIRASLVCSSGVRICDQPPLWIKRLAR